MKLYNIGETQKRGNRNKLIKQYIHVRTRPNKEQWKRKGLQYIHKG